MESCFFPDRAARPYLPRRPDVLSSGRIAAIVRSGSLTPWANTSLEYSTNPLAWFAADGDTIILPTHVERHRRINEGGKPMV